MDIIMDTPDIYITQEILKLITEIDEFKGKWQALSHLPPDQLRQLKKVATIESIGSSTRIEGAKLTDAQVEELLSGIKITNFQSRDEEEVIGYAECIDIVLESFDQIPMDENHIKQLHQALLKHSAKDIHHKGEYKKLSNNVGAFDENGKNVGIVFETASPFDTPQKMEELVAWFGQEWAKEDIHALLIIAILIVHFLAIHPFQDGNGRVSRILTKLLLLKAGYTYMPYNSLERIIEENKERYYLALRKSQETIYTDNSTLNTWIIFFLRSLKKQIVELQLRIKRESLVADISPLSQ